MYQSARSTRYSVLVCSMVVILRVLRTTSVLVFIGKICFSSKFSSCSFTEHLLFYVHYTRNTHSLCYYYIFSNFSFLQIFRIFSYSIISSIKLTLLLVYYNISHFLLLYYQNFELLFNILQIGKCP